MTKNLKSQVYLGILLVLLSAVFYYVHFLIFKDAHHIYIYLLGDIAFVFLEVLLVAMVLHQLLHYREKAAMFKKMNMVIGAFFNEIGIGLLEILTSFNTNEQLITEKIKNIEKWSKKELISLSSFVAKHGMKIDLKRGDIIDLKNFVIERRSFLLNLLKNPNLLEHESFTDALWGISHLTDELFHRKSLKRLSDNDIRHIENDMLRAYTGLIHQWLFYMKHLKEEYPYLFSLALRLNPFDKSASVELN